MNNQDVTLNVDRGEGREVNVELAAESIWVVAGPAMAVAEFWIKQAGGIADLRVRVTRNAVGIEVAVDRGDQSQQWWKAGQEPKLSVSFQPELKLADAVATAGGEMHSLGSVGY